MIVNERTADNLPRITYKDVVNGFSDVPYSTEKINLLRSFAKYLKTLKCRGKPLSEASIKMYINRLLKNYLNKGYSAGDLLGSLNMEIEAWSSGGDKYDKKDHNNTLTALKHLREFHRGDKLPKYIYISQSSGYQSFAANHNHGDHVTFALENDKILEPKKMKMAIYDYYELQELIGNNIMYLSQGNNAFMSFHGPIGYFTYSIGNSAWDTNALNGYLCEKLFSARDNSEQKHVDYLNEQFLNIIGKYR